jgi:hypothetical protein
MLFTNRVLYIFVLLSFLGTLLTNQTKANNIIDKAQIQNVAKDKLNEIFPEYLQVSYADASDDIGESWGLKLDYSADLPFETNAQGNGNNISFDGRGFTFKAKGTYAFSKTNNFDNYSLIQGSYKKRWFNIHAASKKLSQSESAQVQQCVIDNIDMTVDNCRTQYGYGETSLSHFFLDADVHVKLEGDQDFSNRNFAYGFGIVTTYGPPKDSFLHKLNILDYPSRLFRQQALDAPKLPIFAFGLEQVDAKDNEQRLSLTEDEKYDRAYFEISHVSPLGNIKGHPLKLNINWRYFKELDAPEAIKIAKVDESKYLTVALQIPAAVVPGLETTESSIIFSFSKGELPFDRQDQKVFEIGWRSNVNFGDIFKP